MTAGWMVDSKVLMKVVKMALKRVGLTVDSKVV